MESGLLNWWECAIVWQSVFHSQTWIHSIYHFFECPNLKIDIDWMEDTYFSQSVKFKIQCIKNGWCQLNLWECVQPSPFQRKNGRWMPLDRAWLWQCEPRNRLVINALVRAELLNQTLASPGTARAYSHFHPHATSTWSGSTEEGHVMAYGIVFCTEGF